MPRQLLVRGALKITTNERISIVPQSSTSVFQLRFDPVIKEDSGEYRCVFNHKTGAKYKVVVVNIQVRPKVDIDPRGEVDVLEGEYAFVMCNASGTPFPQFRWWMLPLSSYQNYYSQHGFDYYSESQVTLAFPTQNTQSIDSYSLNLPLNSSENYLNLIPVHELALKYKQNIFLRSGKLIINAVNREMTGWYFCEAHNSVKPSAIEHILLSVNYVPQVFLPQREVFFGPYGNVSLVCEFQAFPMTEVEWLLDGRLLDMIPCEYRGFHATTWCTEKKIGLENNTNVKSTHGFSDSLYFLDYPSLAMKEIANKRKGQFRTIDLTKSSSNFNLYGKRLKSILHIWVTEAKHFGRYSCRMQTKYGRAEGFIRLRNKGGPIIEPFGYVDRKLKQKDFVSTALVASPIVPFNGVYTKQESMFPYLYSKTTSSANCEYFTPFLFLLTIITIVHCPTL
nr:lachesin [Hymenolepis microstoma]